MLDRDGGVSAGGTSGCAAMMNGGGEMVRELEVWERSPDEVLAKVLGVSRSKGLSDAKGEVAARRADHGFNELEKAPKKALWKLVLEQFDDALVKILLLAAFVSFSLAIFEEWEAGVGLSLESLKSFVEPLVILVILVLNAIVGVWQESNAERALEALQEMNYATAHVLRDGTWISDLPARELVPGDVVKLSVGDKVPADGRVLELTTATVRIEQASLTGESVPVAKTVEALPFEGDEAIELQAKCNMVFAGTSVANGSCVVAVTSIGAATEIGKTHALIVEAQDEDDDDTPLKRKLDEFGDMLSKLIGVICLIVWLINANNFVRVDFSDADASGKLTFPRVSFDLHKCIYYFKIAVALAVAAIPEGLPAVITTCLALGTRKMAKQNAIVRKLPSVETLGCTSIICSDKTGTLTSNQMSCISIVSVGQSGLESHRVTGHTYDPDGGDVQGPAAMDASLETLMRVCALCNDAGIEYKSGEDDEVKFEPKQTKTKTKAKAGGTYGARGSPTEAALTVLVEKLARVGGAASSAGGLGAQEARRQDPAANAEASNRALISSFVKRATLEFNRNRKSMSVLAARRDRAVRGTRQGTREGVGANALYVKGAPESILARCDAVLMPDGTQAPLRRPMRAAIADVIADMSSQALRCLAIAVKDRGLGVLESYDGTPSHPGHKLVGDPDAYAAIESGLCFVGLAALQDPPRPEVKPAIASCYDAGIRVIVITGDNQLTAEAICRDIGIFGADENLDEKSFTCSQFAKLAPSEQRAILGGPGGLVFSRAEPKHKQDIIRTLKGGEDVIAMTGDGVNDAPALALADIGVAMGIAGTEVAKEASDMVLADDNFNTIVSAVREGRSIYNNMKAFIRYMISSNIGEVASIFITAALGLPEGLIPVQLLWVNLVTDGPPATALGFNPPDPDVMEKRPRSNKDSLITPWVLFRYCVIGLYVGFATVGVFVVWYTHSAFLGIDLSKDGHTTVSYAQLSHWDECRAWNGFRADPYTAGSMVFSFEQDPCDYFEGGKAKASTLSLTVLVAIEMFNALNALSEDMSLITVPPWANPYLLVAMVVSFALHFAILYVPSLTQIFSITPLSKEEWYLVLAFSLPVILVDEGLKMIGRAITRAERESSQRGSKRKAD